MVKQGITLVHDLVNTARQCIHEVQLKDVQNDELAMSYQQQVRRLAAEQRSLTSANLALTTNTAHADELARHRTDQTKKANETIASLKEEISQAKLQLESLEVDKAAVQDSLSRRDRQAAEDAATIQRLRAQIADFTQLKLTSEARLVNESTLNMRLTRDSKESETDATLRANRIQFLDAERTRLSHELAEARSQLEIANSTHSAALRTANTRISELSEELTASKVIAKQSADEVVSLGRQISEIQSERERARMDSLRETTKLSKLVEMHRDAAKDAEIQVSEYKELLATMAFDKKTEASRPRPTGRLDEHAEVVLKNMQDALARRAEDLQEQSRALDKAKKAELKIATSHERLARELRQTKQNMQITKSKAELLEKELVERNNKIDTLERRLVLMGGHQASSPPFSRRQTLDSTIPDAGFGSQKIPVQLSTPMMVSPPDQFLESSIEEMVELRRRHENILSALKGHAESHSGLMTD